MNDIQLLEDKFVLLDSIPVGACILQEDFTVVFWNKCLEEWTHIPSWEIIGGKIGTYFPHLMQPKYFSRFKQIFEGGPPTIFSAQLHKYIIPAPLPNQQFRIQHTTVTPIPRLNNRGFYALLVIQDLTELTNRIQDYRVMRDQALAEIKERRQAEAQLQQKTRELEQRNLELTHLRAMNDLLQSCLAMKEAYPVVSQSIEKLFPDLEGGLFIIDRDRQSLESVVTWGDNNQIKTQFLARECWALHQEKPHFAASQESSLSCQHLHIPGTEYGCIPMMVHGEALGVLHLSCPLAEQLTEAQQLLAVTVTENVALALANLKLRETLQYQSIRDPLTGLFNRRYMEEFLNQEIHRAQQEQHSLGIIMVDVDRFKEFNDAFGHEAGDRILRELALCLQRQLRGLDIACRYGGDELLLILPETSLTGTWQRAEKLRAEVKNLKVWHRQQFLGAIALSLGVACFPEHGLKSEAVLRAADAALLRAKKEGRDRTIAAS